jgi:hypothetical protein
MAGNGETGISTIGRRKVARAPAPVPDGIDPGALELPAIWVNHLQITQYSAGLVRVSFAETPVPNMPVYRTAILMTVGDARQLGLALAQIGGPEPSSALRN